MYKQKKNREDASQLQLDLWKEVQTKTDEVQEAVKGLFVAVRKFTESGGIPWGPGEQATMKVAKPFIEIEADRLRKQINKAVKIAAFNEGGRPEHYRNRWMAVYSFLRQKLGFCPALAANKNGGSKLDAVQDAGLLKEALDVASKATIPEKE